MLRNLLVCFRVILKIKFKTQEEKCHIALKTTADSPVDILVVILRFKLFTVTQQRWSVSETLEYRCSWTSYES